MTAASTTRPIISAGYQLPKLRFGPTKLLRGGLATLAVAAIIAAATTGWSRFAHAYLGGIAFCLSVSLGALFFVMLQHLTGARWSVTVRRVAELLTPAIPWLGVLFVPVLIAMLLGDSHLYEWNDAQLAETDKLIAHKAVYLNATFFAVRCVIYFAVWTGLAGLFLANSVKQDAGDGHATRRLRRWSGPAMLVFALTVNFAAFDLLMSLDPHWFSTIYGVYFFSGSVVALLAALTLFLAFLQARGVLGKEVTVEHYHDLGKLLFGFVFFWGYIAFSQYLLIWYANIPEETGWYAVRQQHGWQIVGLGLLFGHFIFPFCGMMSKAVRRSRSMLVAWSVFLLGMHVIDLYWLIIPSVSPQNALPSLLDALCLLGVVFVWLSVTLRAFAKHRLLSTGDPHLKESLAFHNI